MSNHSSSRARLKMPAVFRDHVLLDQIPDRAVLLPALQQADLLSRRGLDLRADRLDAQLDPGERVAGGPETAAGRVLRRRRGDRAHLGAAVEVEQRSEAGLEARHRLPLDLVAGGHRQPVGAGRFAHAQEHVAQGRGQEGDVGLEALLALQVAEDVAPPSRRPSRPRRGAPAGRRPRSRSCGRSAPEWSSRSSPVSCHRSTQARALFSHLWCDIRVSLGLPVLPDVRR